MSQGKSPKSGRDRKRRAWRDVRAWVYLMVIPYVLVAFATGVYMQLNKSLPLETPTTVVIPPGIGMAQVVARLQDHGLFTGAGQARYLEIWARLSGAARKIHAGEYRIEPGTTALGLLALLSSDKVVQHQVTLVDGWRFSQALAAVRAAPDLRHTLPANATPAQIMAAIGHAGQNPEGRFFPDTYSFPRGETDVALLQTAYAAMARHLEQTWAGRAPKLPFDTPYDALIMASIIEKETAQADELARISGVFARRLQIGMRLQADPTVIYGLGSAYNGDLTHKDLTTDTPYNTYTRTGLPPTPICLPSQAALTAAVHPAAGKALYFVSRGDGTHVFSDTLAEQNAAVRQYQLGQR